MQKMTIFSLLLLFLIKASALAPMNVVAFNHGWPAQGETIPGMPRITSILSAGPYSWAIGYQDNLPAKIAFFDGSWWQTAVGISNLLGISRIVPLYNKGETAQAFALGAGKISYFNGITWQKAESIYDFKNVSLLASEGQAVAISTSPIIQSSFFNQETWNAPQDLSSDIQAIRAVTAVGGSFYLLGLNAQGNLTLLFSTETHAWQRKNFNVTRPINMQMVAGQDILVVAAICNQQNFFTYSKDAGKTWHETTWPGGMLFSKVNKGILWNLQWETENKAFAYFNSHETNPKWKTIPVPIETTSEDIYSNPSINGTQICISGENSGRATLRCYDINDAQWQHYSSLTVEAKRIDMLIILTNDHFMALGVDQEEKPALFYYDGGIWQVTHVEGLLASVQNLFFTDASSPVWAVGHN